MTVCYLLVGVISSLRQRQKMPMRFPMMQRTIQQNSGPLPSITGSTITIGAPVIHQITMATIDVRFIQLIIDLLIMELTSARTTQQ